jgi:hypothetical protein
MNALEENSPLRQVFAIMQGGEPISLKDLEVPTVTVEYE